ncbi:SDR family NAD(P)-dependent oxidoreductase [Dawidia soli]|uniref:SDR family NAD(P)-dependent oxidoreductase n=1 Tax=Dawidia soli TaxID=2782352 RepID=A0AAP2GHC0_9BACT|nr:SDR family oxidoreductase [Dawidia soli]MBT1686255.1 SDR family NAD(P)-dependent oxidoreductase [Dawidia soli]
MFTLPSIPSLTSVMNISTRNRLLLAGAAGAVALMAYSKWRQEQQKFALAGKVVLITGGSRGLGLVLARMLAAKGARLAICARTPAALDVARQELEMLGAPVLTLPVDITDTAQVDSMIRQVVDHYGRLDVLINNAGTIQVAPQEALNLDDYEKAMKTNFWAALYTTLSSIPYFRAQGGGRIVNITSIGGKVAVPHLLPYTASKFALVGLSEGMHTELKKHNIRVTTVVPGLMRTGSTQHITVKGDHEAEYRWFKVSASSALLSVKAETAAASIVEALEYGRPEALVSISTKLATLVKGVAPGWMGSLLSMAERFLPDNVPGGEVAKQGSEAESTLSRLLGKRSEAAALQNNE